MNPARIASLALVGTCALWAFSFPLLKALERLGHVNVPGASSLFLSALLVAWRFAFAGLCFAAHLVLRRLRRGPAAAASPTRAEWAQGAGVGLFGGLGLVLQMDGLAYTHGSVSAFLTQGYAVLIPLWVALTERRPPGWNVTGACALVCLGAAVLAGVSRDNLALGRGEWETLAGSVLFAAQILWLERPRFAGNDSIRTTAAMFVTMAAVTAPMAAALAARPGDLLRAYASADALLLFGLLTVACTLATFPVANHWQPKLPATQAGLLYCTEPVFTSLACLFVPGWLSRLTGIAYADETLTANLLLGGGCILAANVWLQLRPVPPARDAGLRPDTDDPRSAAK